jgi:putative oxidoreductase
MKTFTLVMRLLLGLVYLVFSLNAFFNFIPMPPIPEKAAMFIGALYASGYAMYTVKFFEIITAVFLLLNRFTPLALVILFPISLNIFLFGLFLNPAGLPIGIFVLAANLFLMFVNIKAYKPLFKA